MNPYAGPLRITVRTYRTDTASVIVVTDNGPGFDPVEVLESHTTLSNICQRLEWMCGGKLEITPRDGGGTVVTVTIPDGTAEQTLPDSKESPNRPPQKKGGKKQMNYRQILRKLFLYAGVEKEEYNSLSGAIRKENLVLLSVFSQLAGIMFFLLYITSMITQGFATVTSSTYLICGFVMLAIMLCVRFIVPKHPALVTALVYVFEIVLYVFSIRISMLHADKPAVSAVAFLLVSPLLFYDRPVRLSAMIGGVAAVFCAIAYRFKQLDVASIDAWNTITFGLVAVVTTVFTMSIKVRALSQSRQIEYLSQTDLMTGVKNRNHYEEQLLKYPDMCASGLICVYGDVNGLHELNYREGHQAGDKMLLEVAEAMRQYFGAEHTYRVGGDEFVAFRMDGHPEGTVADVARMSQALDEKGYHVSFGTAVYVKAEGAVDMHELVKEAEYNMYAVKQDFYRQPEHNRRNR